MRLLLPVLASILLAGCAQSVDIEQARACRIALAALAPPEAAIEVLAQRGDADGAGVAVDYAADGARGTIRCRFEPAPDHPGRLRVAAVDAGSGPLNPAQLHFLRRFWLDTSEGWRSDPEPVPGSMRAAEIPFAAAYGLQQGLNALPMAASYALLAAAYSLVYGLSGRLNLAFGEFAALGGYAAVAGVALAAGSGPLAGLALALVLAAFAAAMHGIAAGRLVFAPLARAPGLNALVATIGLAVFLQEYLRLTQGSAPRWIAPMLNAPFALARAPGFVVTLTPMALLVAGLASACACALLVLMKFSRFGREWRAMADDALAAQLFGISPEKLFAQTFALACALAGLSGASLALFHGTAGYAIGTTLGLKALVAAILGGIGSLPGAFAGGLAIGLAEAAWSALYPIEYRDLVTFCLLAAALILRPGGLLGYADAAPPRHRG